MQLKYPVYTNCVNFCTFIDPCAVVALAVSLAHFSLSGAVVLVVSLFILGLPEYSQRMTVKTKQNRLSRAKKQNRKLRKSSARPADSSKQQNEVK